MESIIITILCLGLLSNCFVIRNLVTVIFQAKEERTHVLNEKNNDQVPQRAHKKMPIYIRIYSNQVLKYVKLKRRLFQHLIAVNLNIYWHFLMYSLGNLITVFSLSA